jgi:hypothetical protein
MAQTEQTPTCFSYNTELNGIWLPCVVKGQFLNTVPFSKNQLLITSNWLGFLDYLFQKKVIERSDIRLGGAS